MVHILLMSDVKTGGWVSNVKNLVRRCRADGVDAMGVQPAGRAKRVTDWLIRRPLIDILTAKEPMLVYCVHMKRFGSAVLDLVARGATIRLADPTEFDPDLLEAIKRTGNEVLVNRVTNQKALEEKGIEARRLPQPFERKWDGLDPGRERTRFAVSTSRVDWDKHQEITVGANGQVEPERAVQIFGTENRIYGFHKLDKAAPGWRQWYHGEFGHEENPVRDARIMVDMSAIKGDGGGSQFTFLEGQDAGATLALNRAWFGPDGPESGADPTGPRHALVAETAEELVGILEEPPNGEDERKRRELGYELLRQHTEPGLGKRYVAHARRL